MIRARAGNFTYSDDEVEIMKASIRDLDALADGFVFGAITGAGEVDVECCGRLMAARISEKPCIFHRAVDETSGFLAAMEVIKNLNFDGAL